MKAVWFALILLPSFISVTCIDRTPEVKASVDACGVYTAAHLPSRSIASVPVACPSLSKDEEITAWRKTMSEGVYGEELNTALDRCFPTRVPACLLRLKAQAYGQNEDIYETEELQNSEPDKEPRRQVPKELLISGSDDFNYVFRPDAEAIAKSKGWPVVKYKSRHSGGFDPQSSSLLMIEVPGASLTPPTNYDRFINIAIPKDDVNDGTEPSPTKNIPTPEQLKGPDGDKYPHIATIVGVERANAQKPAQVFFQLYRREGSIYRSDNDRHPENACYECHSSGLREISPLGYGVDQGEAQLPPEAWKMVKRINDDMRGAQGDGPADWGSFKNKKTGKLSPVVDTDRYGPVIGPSEPLTREMKKDMNGKSFAVYPTRSEAFIVGTTGENAKAGCANLQTTIEVKDIFDRAPGEKNVYKFTSNPPVDWRKVANAMDCQSCHDGGQRGILNSKTDKGLVAYKILVDKSMPHGSHQNPMENGGPNQPVTDDLNLNERIALVNCLQEESYSEQAHLQEWLTEIPCNENSKSPSARRANELLNKLREKSCQNTPSGH